MATLIGAAQNLGGSGVFLGGRSLVRTAAGGIYFVGRDSVADPEAVTVWYSADGVAFAEKDNANRPTASGAGDTIDGVAAAIDSNDIIHIFWHADEDEEYNYSTFATVADQWNGGAAANVVTIAIDDDPVQRPHNMVSIAIDSGDIPHVAYVSDTILKGQNYDTVYYNNRIGGAWNGAGLEIEGQATSQSCHQLEIAIDDVDIPVIVYVNATTTTLTAVEGNQNDANDFSTSRAVDATVREGVEQLPSIAVDSNGDVWVGYLDDDLTVTIAKQSANWTDPWTVVADGDTADKGVSIAINGTVVYVFYQDDNDDIRYNRYNGGWLGETNLHTGTYDFVRVRWSSYNNPAYSTYGMDYVFTDLNDVWWDRLIGIPPIGKRRIFITHV